ncbi:MAG: hypothetical protein H6972_13370 [Gammaproteobacteria bacterium]|nr:hypothetical protein [Gammaproteobacteria bacterium]
MRGGSWNNDAENCRSAIRNRNDPGNRNDNLGFRLASTNPVFPPDGRRSWTAFPRVRFVQPCRAHAGLGRTKSPSSPASGSASDGRRGYSLDRPGLRQRPRPASRSVATGGVLPRRGARCVLGDAQRSGAAFCRHR